MNILYLQSYPHWTPMTTVHTVLAEGLAPLGMQVHVAAPRSTDPERPGVLERLGAAGSIPLVEAEILPSIYERKGTLPLALSVAAAPLALARLVRYVKQHDIRLVHVASHGRDLVTGALVARASRVPLVAHLHTNFATWFSRSMRFGLRHADAVIAISEFVARTAREGGIRPERLAVVPNAIDASTVSPSRSAEDVRRDLGVSPGAPVVVTVARIVQWKGLDRLVAAFDIARRAIPNAELVVVGDAQDTYAGSLEFLQAVKADVGRRGLSSVVHFVGRRSDVPDVLAASDVFALASREEPFGLVYLEAMAASRPVVAERSGGTPEVVAEGESALLAQPDDIPGFAAALVRLLGDPGLRASMGQAGKARARARFGVPEVSKVAYRVLDRVARRVPLNP